MKGKAEGFLEFKSITIMKLLCVALLCFSALLLTAMNTAQADVWYVKTDGTDPDDCSGGDSWDTAFQTIPKAINCAAAGDEIWVRQGIYPLLSAIYVDKPAHIFGGFDGTETARDQRDWENNETRVDGQGSAQHCFYAPAKITIDGFTITGGNSGSDGGGIWCDFTATIANCRISGNYARHGGGIYSHGFGSTITNCVIRGNTANNSGGGIYNYGPGSTITNCVIRGNTADYGGGIYNYGSGSTIKDCALSGNNAFLYNGGGIYNYGSGSRIINCTFHRNRVDRQGWGGGGIYNDRSDPIITNCTFYRNSGSYGGGIRNSDASPTLTNCILWRNAAQSGGPQIHSDALSYPTLTYCDVEGGYDGNGNIDEDPKFVDADNGDFQLQVCSPCIDAGTNNTPLPNTDKAGNPRICDGDCVGESVVDMGAYESCPICGRPVADAGPDQIVFEEVTLDGSASYDDPNGTIISWDWALLHQTDPECSRTASGEIITVPDLSPGFYIVTLTVTDNDGLCGTDEMLFAASGCKGDFNGDSNVDGSDLAAFAANFGRTDCPSCK